ncbi:MAG TPA: M48 family metallopeptidase [bacterium]|nr:M48 family metallopeptidase [bacterium]
MPNADSDHIVIIAGIGAVLLRRHARARNIVLRLTDDGDPVVTVPRWVPYGDAIDFVISRRDWIVRQQRERAAAPAAPPPLPSEPIAVTREEARPLLERRIAELARRHDLVVTRVTVRAQRTVWGSCAVDGGININWRTARLPDTLRDYVILHELAHLIYRSHGPRYWRALDRLVGGDARTLDRELRRWPLAAL